MTTSAEALAIVVENGLVKDLHKRIVRVMKDNDAPLGISAVWMMSTSEIAAALGVARDLISPRMPELRRMNVVKRGDRRACRITGFRVNTWVLTRQAPVVPPKQYFMKCEHCKGKGKIEIFEIEGGQRLSR